MILMFRMMIHNHHRLQKNFTLHIINMFVTKNNADHDFDINDGDAFSLMKQLSY